MVVVVVVALVVVVAVVVMWRKEACTYGRVGEVGS